MEGKKEKQLVVMLSRDRTRAGKPEKQGDGHGLLVFNDSCMTKFITMGRPTAFCFQLYTQGGVAVWKQVAVPKIGHRSIMLMPVRRLSYRVDRPGQGWQGSTWPPAAGAAEKQPGVMEVVLKGVTKETNLRSREVVLFTGSVRTPDSKNEILHKQGGGAGAK